MANIVIALIQRTSRHDVDLATEEVLNVELDVVHVEK